MRAVPRDTERGDERAALALDVYLHHLRAGIAQMAAAMGGLDALVFSGGVGENAPTIQARAAGGLEFLGVAIDPATNVGEPSDRELSAPRTTVATLLVEAREDLEIPPSISAAGVETCGQLTHL
jgi:acetate kinase